MSHALLDSGTDHRMRGVLTCLLGDGVGEVGIALASAVKEQRDSAFGKERGGRR
jgi:hypothetical protein